MNEYGRPQNSPYNAGSYYTNAAAGYYGNAQSASNTYRRNAQSDGGGLLGSLSSLLGGIKLDEEKLVIIFLIIILARNGADLPLLIALGYLLM